MSGITAVHSVGIAKQNQLIYSVGIAKLVLYHVAGNIDGEFDLIWQVGGFSNRCQN